MSKPIYDVVYYWTGGTERGQWREVLPNVYPEYKDIRTLVADIERSGYVAVTGKRSIGAPEGPPSAERINDVLRVR